ncbi:MAG: hypothetical protein DRP87_14590 [Spirochaetes bacterium]|nr:MAG: hypothetical protein DRP87_14590 [Spirochaetota bacterium]
MAQINIKLFKKIENNRLAYFYLLPSLLFMIVLIGYPLGRAITLSFFHDTGFGTVLDFIGLKNYIRIFKNHEFWLSFGRTVIWTITSVISKTLIGLLGALLLNQVFAGRGLARALILPPWIIPLPIGAYVWTWLYNGQHGLN